MRKLSILPAIMIATLLITSCSKTDMNILSISEAESIIPGSYKVNDFANGDGDFAQFENYTFEFKSNGNVVATKGDESFTGTWDISTTNTDPVYDKEVSITIAGNTEVEDLSHVWYVKEVTDVTLDLIEETIASEVLFIKI